jgi:hypothetical protein
MDDLGGKNNVIYFGGVGSYERLLLVENLNFLNDGEERVGEHVDGPLKRCGRLDDANGNRVGNVEFRGDVGTIIAVVVTVRTNGNVEAVAVDVVKRRGVVVIACGRTKTQGFRIVQTVRLVVKTDARGLFVDNELSSKRAKVIVVVADFAGAVGSVLCLHVGGEVDGGGVVVVEVKHKVHKVTGFGGAANEGVAGVVILVLETGDIFADIHIGTDKDLGGGGVLLHAAGRINLVPVGNAQRTIGGANHGTAAERNRRLDLANRNVAKLILEVKGVGLDTTEKVVPGEGVLGPKVVDLKIS